LALIVRPQAVQKIYDGQTGDDGADNLGRPTIPIARSPQSGFDTQHRLLFAEIMVIGGATLYGQLLPYCDRLYVTEVQAEIKGDAYFPVLEREDWNISKEQRFFRGLKDDYDFVFRILDRRR